ncbi:MAG: universal stress protein [Desulfuromonadales bacterium]|nr:universal stress protein [Desulfuromonadales bacterium]
MGLQIKRILVGKDLTAESLGVLRYALELGSKFDAEIHLLHVMPKVDQSVQNMISLVLGADKLAEVDALNESSMAAQTRTQLETILREETERGDVALSRPPQILVLHGEAAPTILTVADRLDVDMIILGSHSKGKMHYAFLGSVAEKILRKTHRTVVIVPPGSSA